jgi:hypothetical protein
VSKEDGGPAFPILDVHQPWNNDERKYDGVETGVTSSGMSLRDYFAGRVLANSAIAPYTDRNEHSVAKNAYLIADAMLKARQT